MWVWNTVESSGRLGKAEEAGEGFWGLPGSCQAGHLAALAGDGGGADCEVEVVSGAVDGPRGCCGIPQVARGSALYCMGG